jgi:type I restriction enzyme S subunit
VDYVDDFLFDGEYLLIAEDGENLRTRKTPIAFVAEGKFWVNNHAHVVQGNHLANTRYLCYVLARTNIAGFLSGSTQPKLTQAALNAIPVDLPSRAYQDQVVDILRALDDKIAVNDRICASLSELATYLFKQATKDSAEWLRLGDIATVSMGQSPPGETCNREGIGHPLLNGPTEFGALLPTAAQWTTGAARFCQRGDLLLCVRGSTTGRLNRADQEYAIGRGLAAIRGHRPGSTSLIHFALIDSITDLLAFADGSVFPNLPRTAIENHRVAWPPPPLVAKTADNIDALVKKMTTTNFESRVLSRLRNVLLPGLMSGQIRVRKAEKVVEEVL